MAIQVGGTTVIDNTPNLVNVGGLKTVGGNSILGSGDIAVGGGAPNYDGGRTTGYSENGTMPVGATIIADGTDSYLGAIGQYHQISRGAEYGKSYSMSGGTDPFNSTFLRFRGSNSNGSNVASIAITYGTWQIINSSANTSNAGVLCLRVS